MIFGIMGLAVIIGMDDAGRQLNQKNATIRDRSIG